MAGEGDHRVAMTVPSDALILVGSPTMEIYQWKTKPAFAAACLPINFFVLWVAEVGVEPTRRVNFARF
jgi:hypothetical protein